MLVSWAGILSDLFDICNKVRQCGILLPFFFAVYIDELPVYLQSMNSCCRLKVETYNY